ncbi:MAG TPA: RsmE family RNA methyltransferase [Acidimicrobiales bacterium]|nr:RsmE family RNA methyltransferase [Acidimicrobiales bacterium]
MADAADAAAALAVRAAAAAQVFVGDPAHPVLGPEDAHHLGRVLRLAPGERVVAADGAGRWCPCVVAPGPGGRPVLEVDGDVVTEAAPRPRLTVAFAPVKGDRPEWVVQKLVELGIDRIVPLATERSVVRWEGGRAERAVERLGRVAAEAAAQSRRVWLPELTAVTPLDALAGVVDPDPVALAQPGGTTPRLDRPVVAVGPEGGFSPGELRHAPVTVGLGPTVLRAETAAVAAGVLMAALRAGTVAPGGTAWT